MFRPGTIDSPSAGGTGACLSTSFLAQALENLVTERQTMGSPSFAIEQLCAALLAPGGRAADDYFGRLIDCGISVEAIYETYIPRAAQRLGEMWCDDTLGFCSVTLGMSRLTDAFRRLSPEFLRGRRQPERPRRALFAATPGEQHCLGMVIAADYFRRDGWNVRVELKAGRDALARIAGEERPDLIGLTAGSRRMIPIVAETAAALRRAAPDAPIVLGGALAAIDDDVAARVGVDRAVSAARSALLEFETVL